VNWTVNGIDLSSVVQTQINPVVVLADASSVIVGWQDFRGGSSYDIYAQKISGGGIPLWAPNGVQVVATANADVDLELIHNGAGGAIFAYETGTDVGGQHLNAGGAKLWGTAGILISGAVVNNQYNPRIISDGAGGAIVVWDDNSNSPDDDVYAQRISPTGGHMWDYLGSPVCTSTADQSAPSLAPDGQGGAILVWRDTRSTSTLSDIYAQRMDASGQRLWGSSGRAVLNPNGGQSGPAVHSDGNGNALFSCYDSRGFDTRITTQRIDGQLGYWGYPEPEVYSVADTPGDQGGHVSLNWYRSERDKIGQNLITNYSIWRAIDALPCAAASATGPSRGVGLQDKSPALVGPADRGGHAAAAGNVWA
jgi:hypothetical protein